LQVVDSAIDRLAPIMGARSVPDSASTSPQERPTAIGASQPLARPDL
jgi:hypothetical protein